MAHSCYNTFSHPVPEMKESTATAPEEMLQTLHNISIYTLLLLYQDYFKCSGKIYTPSKS
jgi:hypothetical protein